MRGLQQDLYFRAITYDARPAIDLLSLIAKDSENSLSHSVATRLYSSSGPGEVFTHDTNHRQCPQTSDMKNYPCYHSQLPSFPPTKPRDNSGSKNQVQQSDHPQILLYPTKTAYIVDLDSENDEISFSTSLTYVGCSSDGGEPLLTHRKPPCNSHLLLSHFGAILNIAYPDEYTVDASVFCLPYEVGSFQIAKCMVCRLTESYVHTATGCKIRFGGGSKCFQDISDTSWQVWCLEVFGTVVKYLASVEADSFVLRRLMSFRSWLKSK